jgi:signal transduction histidine kinase
MPPRANDSAGTPLAMSAHGAMRRYTSYRTEQTARVASRWLALRPWVVMPYAAVQLTVLFVGGLQRERFAAMVALYVAHHASLFYWRARVNRGADVGDVAFRSNLWVLLVHAPLVTLTGGLIGPLAPSLLGVVTGNVVAFGNGPRAKVTIALAAVMALAIPIASRVLGPATLSPGFATLSAVVALLFSLFMASTIVMNLASAYESAGESLDAARTELVDESLARARSLERVGAHVAHELKNPLAAIKALVQLAASTPNEEKRAQRLAIASTEIDRMESVLRAYLTFERPLEALNTEPVDLGELAAEAIALLDDRAAVAGVTLACEADPVVAEADARRLKSALIDLVSNAIEASARGGQVRVTVREAGACAEIVVADEGRGMTATELARVGTAFFTTREGGSGLGVVLARQTVVQHGGALRYESAPGRGTRATLSLPLESRS